jgi:hypothetical protein
MCSSGINNLAHNFHPFGAPFHQSCLGCLIPASPDYVLTLHVGEAVAVDWHVSVVKVGKEGERKGRKGRAEAGKERRRGRHGAQNGSRYAKRATGALKSHSCP